MLITKQVARSLTALAVGMSTAVFADNPILFTIEGPAIQESQAISQVITTEESWEKTLVSTQTFESVPHTDEVFQKGAQYDSFDWDEVGTYVGSGGKIDNHNKYGSAGGIGKYLFIKNTGSNHDTNPGVTLTFDIPVAYFGFWWSAGDHNNKLKVTLVDGSVVDVVTSLVLASEGFDNRLASEGGHKGNPTAGYIDQNSGEGYAYLNLFVLEEGRKIQSIRFHGTNFETDNHTISTSLLTPTGTTIPLPPSVNFGITGRFSLREINTHIVRDNTTDGESGGNSNGCYENSNGNANENCQGNGHGHNND